MKPISAL